MKATSSTLEKKDEEIISSGTEQHISFMESVLAVDVLVIDISIVDKIDSGQDSNQVANMHLCRQTANLT